MYPETIDWCTKIIKSYTEERMEALHLTASSYFNMFDIDSCLKYLAQIWQMNGEKFEDEYMNDKRFKKMFLDIAHIYRNNHHKE